MICQRKIIDERKIIEKMKRINKTKIVEKMKKNQQSENHLHHDFENNNFSDTNKMFEKSIWNRISKFERIDFDRFLFLNNLF